jgi:hypothetical protein
MEVSKAVLRAEVERKLKPLVYRDIIQFMGNKELKLWGEDRPRLFQQTCVLICMYQDLFGLSLRGLRRAIKSWWPHDRKTLTHNHSRIRKVLGKWGKKKVVLGTAPDWNQAVRNWEMPKGLNGVNLWLDSVDFQQVGKTTEEKTSDRWSFKLNAPGQRYLVLFDGKGKVRQWWGGYTPKLFDGHALQLEKRWLKRNLQGGRVIADQHFAWGTKLSKKVRFHIKFKKHRIPGKKGQMKLGLTKKETVYNRGVNQVRARVESWFGKMGKKVAQLGNIWYGSDEEQDSLVSFAIGVLNSHKG